MAKAKKTIAFNPSTYMELAIEEMNKSKEEARADGKIPPKVGAIILFPNGKIERAHRGELRDGDHAEYTLLERKLGHEKLDDCILFTTLEPCVKRNLPKIGCSKRTVSTRIKTVYVGIQDPDPTVAGKGIKNMEEHGVKVIMFYPEYQKQIEEANQEFLEQAKHRAKKVVDEDLLSDIEKVSATSDFNSLSNEALDKFIKEAKLEFKITDKDFKEYLADVGILGKEEGKKSHKPTGLGILLFGKNPRAKYHQAVLKAHVDYGNGNIEPIDFAQPLVLVPDLVESWLKKVLPLTKDTSKFKRQDVPSFPIEVLREAIINALIHRDYSIEGAKSTLEIDNEKIVVKSPGLPLPSITLEQLNTFKAPSISRNPIISYVFSLMDYVEEKGFGMKALKSLNEKYKLPLPEYRLEDPFLVLTFPRTMEAVKNVLQHKALTELNKEELEGYEWIKSKGKVTRKEYETFSGFDKKKAERILTKLYDNGLIERKGAGPSTYYMIIAT